MSFVLSSPRRSAQLNDSSLLIFCVQDFVIMMDARSKSADLFELRLSKLKLTI